MPENDISLPPTPSSPSMKRALANAPTSPAKTQSKWTAQEDALIIQLRGMGKKWDDISKALPGRSPISCRLHYQNYLERRSEWDEDRKNQLAMLYERYDNTPLPDPAHLLYRFSLIFPGMRKLAKEKFIMQE